jgi:hypothetical protein
MDGQQVLEREFSNVGSMCLQDGMQKVRPGREERHAEQVAFSPGRHAVDYIRSCPG